MKGFMERWKIFIGSRDDVGQRFFHGLTRRVEGLEQLGIQLGHLEFAGCQHGMLTERDFDATAPEIATGI